MLLTVLTVGAGTPPASAEDGSGHQTTLPDSNGQRVRCNVGWPEGFNTYVGIVGTDGYKVQFACQYGAAASTVTANPTFTSRGATNNAGGVPTTATYSGSSRSCDFTTATTNSGGKFRCESTFGWGDPGSTTDPDPAQWDCQLQVGGTTTALTTCVVLSVVVGTPLMPADYFPGGTVGDLPPLQATCSRVLTRGTAGNVATFTGTGQPGTATYSWVFGDGASSTAQSPQHVYPSLSSMPTDGWTATLTVTRGSDSSTAACSLRVDFLHPNEAVPGSTGGTSQSEDDTDCPSGWGILNPSSFGQLLRCLFVPSGEPWEDLKDAYQGSFIDVGLEPAEAVLGAWESMARGRSDTLSTGIDPCVGPEMNVPLGTPTEGGPPFEVEIRPLYACTEPLKTMATILRVIETGALYLGAAMVLAKMLGRSAETELL